MCTSGFHRGTGPSTWGKIRRPNAGKDHLPAGTGNNLQGLPGPGTTKAWKRVMVRRMSPYEPRRGSNVPPGGHAGHPGADSACSRQRGSRYLAGRKAKRDYWAQALSPALKPDCRATRETDQFRGVCRPVLKPRYGQEALVGISQDRQPDSGNPTVRDENGGSRKRGPWRTVNPPRTTERAIVETLSYRCARLESIQTAEGLGIRATTSSSATEGCLIAIPIAPKPHGIQRSQPRQAGKRYNGTGNHPGCRPPVKELVHRR